MIRRVLAIVTTMIRYAPVLALVAVLTAGNADAFIQPGAQAPNFTKNQLVNGAAGATWSLTSQAPKVVILFVLGYY